MVSELRHVGFFSDLTYGDPDEPALAAMVAPAGEPWEADAIRYLEGGDVLAVRMMLSYDELDPAHPAIDPLQIRTDGTFAWPSDLAYYLARYHCVLPDDFVEHMRAQGWKSPVLDIDGDDYELG